MPLLPAGHRSLRVLHLSDLHLTPRQHRKREWVSSLAGLRPDLVVDTGDNLAHRDSLPVVLDALGGLLDVPGVFVLGSNDYYSPVLRNPLRYLLPDDGTRNTTSEQLEWRELKAALDEAGWIDLSNARAAFTVGDTTFAFAGVDDPHLEYDRLDDVAGLADPTADVRIGVTHAPYLRVLDQFAHDGYDAGAGGPHPRRPGVPAGWPGPGHQLRPRAGPGQGAAPPPGRLRARRTRVELAARLRRPRHLSVRPGPAVVPPRGDAAHPHGTRLSSPGRFVAPVGARVRLRLLAPGTFPARSGCGAAW